MARNRQALSGAATAKPEIKTPSLPAPATVVVSDRGAARLKSGHVWVYRSDVLSAEGVPPGALVPVADRREKRLGSALYSTASQIAIRLISTSAVEDFSALLRERIQQALAFRERVVTDTNACRIVFSEADFLPGLTVDRYNDILAMQVLTQAMDTERVRQTVISELWARLNPAAIIERVDPRIRELEQLPARESAALQGDKTETIFTMNGVKFHYSAFAGQKTGSFLDQRENYAATAQYARGEALDVFCYQGGFALHLVPRCTHVTGVDSSRPALEVADQNAALNGVEIEWLEANAFDLLKDYSAAGRQFDTIVLDPPAFAKSRRNLETAMRGYKELNLRALKMLRPGGILATCSCSFHVSQEEFLEVLTQAALDVHRTPRILEVRGQAKDHPVLPAVPETRYLKCVLFHIS